MEKYSCLEGKNIFFTFRINEWNRNFPYQYYTSHPCSQATIIGCGSTRVDGYHNAINAFNRICQQHRCPYAEQRKEEI